MSSFRVKTKSLQCLGPCSTFVTNVEICIVHIFHVNPQRFLEGALTAIKTFDCCHVGEQMVQVKSGCVREWLTCNSLGEVIPPFIWVLGWIHLYFKYWVDKSMMVLAKV